MYIYEKEMASIYLLPTYFWLVQSIIQPPSLIECQQRFFQHNKSNVHFLRRVMSNFCMGMGMEPLYFDGKQCFCTDLPLDDLCPQKTKSEGKL